MAVGKVRVLAVVLVLLVGVAVLIVSGHWVTALGVAALGALTIGGKVWKRWQNRIVEWIDDGSRRLITRFDRRYREFMLGKVRFIDLKGLVTVGFYTPELDEVFIDLSLAYRAPGQVPEGVLAQLPAEVTEQRSIWESLDSQEPQILAIVGVPGSGKSSSSPICPPENFQTNPSAPPSSPRCRCSPPPQDYSPSFSEAGTDPTIEVTWLSSPRSTPSTTASDSWTPNYSKAAY